MDVRALEVKIVADPSGFWSPPKGWRVSHDPVGVVTWDPGTEPRLWVQGSRPVAIMRNIAHLWGWSLKTLSPPSEVVGTALECFWPYGNEAAAKLLRLLDRDLIQDQQRLSREILVDDAQKLSGGLVFWRLPAGRPEHLAGLLRALFDRGIEEELIPRWTPLAQALCLLWEREAGPILGPLYRFDQLDTLLRAWVLDDHRIPGLQPTVVKGLEQLPKPFPSPLPRLALQWVYKAWRFAFSKNENAFDAVAHLEPDRHAAVEEAARALAEAATVRGSEHTPPEALAWLERAASAFQNEDLLDQVKNLRGELEPLSPPDLPKEGSNLETLLEWGKQYVLHRMWERRQDRNLCSERAEQCRRFGELYLNAYCKDVGRSQVPARSTAAWERVRELLEAGEAVVWVVIDGLPFVYWPVLQQLLLQESNGLSLAEEPRVCGAVIPTDTHYAKWALYSGKLPRAAERLTESHRENLERGLEPWASRLSYGTDLGAPLSQKLGTALSGMTPGDCIVLDFLALDKQYGQHVGDFVRLDRYLKNALDIIAEDILKAVDLVSAELGNQWSLVISADHGAVLDPLPALPSQIPQGQPRGRLAVGLNAHPGDPWTELPLRDCGLPEEEPLSVCLGPERFGVQGVPAGPIRGQHGSLWPDEVLVPVASLKRVGGGLRPLRIEIAEGKAAVGAPGTVLLQLHNPNPLLAVTDITVELTAFGERSRPLSTKRLEGDQLSAVEKITVDKWPSRLPDAGEAVGKVRYRVGGVEQAVDLAGAFYAETLYDSGFDSLFRLEQDG